MTLDNTQVRWHLVRIAIEVAQVSNRSGNCVSWRQLMGVFISKKCENHGLEIEEQVPVLDVIKVITDSFCQVRVATKTVHLRPTGDARFHRVARVVMRNLVLEIANQFRAFWPRSDKAHFAFEHIKELRRLVDVPFSHKRANSKPARVVFRRPTGFSVLFGVKPHTTYL